VHQNGRWRCNSLNQVLGYNDIFAIGDVAYIENDPEYPWGHPGVAPAAIQQGQNLGKNILKLINHETMTPFQYTDKGSMATVGRNKAVVDLSFIRFQGIFAWFVWMFVHIMTLIGFRNKLIVLINWVWNYFSFDRGIRLIIRPYKKQCS
jgi:NADH:ubiquinone reductase (H+-translocating)